ncbi:MAG: hypothetical protein AB7S48_17300 [Bacteroidales bacterium]
MKKHYLVQQPPLTEKYTFLVDNISNNKNWGRTTDIDKIEYNRNLLGDDLNIDIKINLLFTEKGLTTVIPLGRFITIIQIREDENEGAMTFFDFDIEHPIEELKELISKTFSENITKEWIKVYETLKSEFKDEDDIVRLEKPDEPDLS